MEYEDGYDDGFADAKKLLLDKMKEPTFGNLDDVSKVLVDMIEKSGGSAVAFSKFSSDEPLRFGIGSTYFRFVDSLGDVDLNTLSWEGVTDAESWRIPGTSADAITLMSDTSGSMTVFYHKDGAWGSKRDHAVAVIPAGTLCVMHSENGGIVMSTN